MKKLLVLMIAGVSLLVAPFAARAEVHYVGPWQFENTPEFTAIYGRLSGVPNLTVGAAVGVFDADNNCYGAGTYNGTYFALSAYEEDPGDRTSDDYAIPGFMSGQEVVFKVFTDKVYTVTTSSGEPYVFNSHGKYPPLQINLVYEDGDDDDDDDDDGPSPTNPGGGGGGEDEVPDEGGGSGKTPMGVWALAPEEEGVPSGLGGGSGAADSGGSRDRGESVSLIADGGYADVPGGGAPSYSGSSGGSLGSLSRKTPPVEEKKHEIEESGAWKDALQRIEDIMRRPFSKHAALTETDEGPARHEKGMPLPLKVFLLFITPALAVAGAAIKMMQS